MDKLRQTVTLIYTGVFLFITGMSFLFFFSIFDFNQHNSMSYFGIVTMVVSGVGIIFIFQYLKNYINEKGAQFNQHLVEKLERYNILLFSISMAFLIIWPLFMNFVTG